MKRLPLIASFFLALLVLNAGGYYWLLIQTQQRDREEAEVFWQERQNAQEDLITMKIPLAVPYWQGQVEFESATGQVHFQGEYYQLVQQKLQNDTLHVVCVRDGQAKARHQALAEFVQQFAQTGDDEEGDSASLLKNFSKDYLSKVIQLAIGYTGWEADQAPASHYSFALLASAKSLVVPPPRG
jgi:hypothetical protein